MFSLHPGLLWGTLATNLASRQAARGNSRKVIYLLLQRELAALSNMALWPNANAHIITRFIHSSFRTYAGVCFHMASLESGMDCSFLARAIPMSSY